MSLDFFLLYAPAAIAHAREDNTASDARRLLLDFRLFFAYAVIVPNTRTCRVSFTDTEGIVHAVQVPAASLYEAAALAVAEFRRCGFMNDATPGPATRLTVTVEAPLSVHELPVGKLMRWLESGVKSPREEVLRNRLREVLAQRQ